MKLPDRYVVIPGSFQPLPGKSGWCIDERVLPEVLAEVTKIARANEIFCSVVLVLKSRSPAIPASGEETITGENMVEICVNGRRYVRKED